MQERKKRPSLRKAETTPKPIPPRTEVEEEKRACGLALDLATKWMEEGTAPAQIVLHFLKIASQQGQADLEKTQCDIELAKAKKKSIESQEEQEKKYQEVIKAISAYAGKDQEWETIEDDYPDYYEE